MEQCLHSKMSKNRDKDPTLNRFPEMDVYGTVLALKNVENRTVWGPRAGIIVSSMSTVMYWEYLITACMALANAPGFKRHRPYSWYANLRWLPEHWVLACTQPGFRPDVSQSGPRCHELSLYVASLSITPSSCLSKGVPHDAQKACSDSTVGIS